MEVYATLDESMIALHAKGDTTEAENIAHIIIQDAEVPLKFRVRAHAILSCSRRVGSDYLGHAQKAVHFAELGLPSTPSAASLAFVAGAKEMLAKAEAAFKEEIADLASQENDEEDSEEDSGEEREEDSQDENEDGQEDVQEDGEDGEEHASGNEAGDENITTAQADQIIKGMFTVSVSKTGFYVLTFTDGVA